MTTQLAPFNHRLLAYLGVTDAPDGSINLDPAVLPGRYAQLIAEKRALFESRYPVNLHEMNCKHCSQSAIYNLGDMLISEFRWRQFQKAAKAPGVYADVVDYIQETGYFRCPHCGKAGAWYSTSPAFSQSVLQALTNAGAEYEFGDYKLYDGFIPKWASDGEAHLLDKIHRKATDAYAWFQLGQLYDVGGRPELGAAAYERALSLDPALVEAHAALASLLADLGEREQAASHLRLSLLYAPGYAKLSAEHLRETLAASLKQLAALNRESGGELPLLPTADEIQRAADAGVPVVEIDASLAAELTQPELQDAPEASYFPAAEQFMSEQQRRRLTASPEHKKGRAAQSKKGKKK